MHVTALFLERYTDDVGMGFPEHNPVPSLNLTASQVSASDLAPWRHAC
jgi:hypothetical protein